MADSTPAPLPDSDIVDRFVELLRHWSPQAAAIIGDKGLHELGDMLRHEFAGEEVYLAKVSRGKRQGLVAQVEQLLAQRVNVTAIARQTGLSRSEVYRRKQRYEAGLGRLSRFSGK